MSRLSIIAAVIAALLMLCVGESANAQIIRVTVERQDCSDGRYCRRVRDCGSGVVIATQGERTYALTAAHVVSRGGTLRVQETAPAKVVARDDQADVALLEISGRYQGTVSQLGGAIAGRAVHLCGYGGGELARADGVLSSPEWITATARDGDSGGPVFDSQTSLVVGIATGVDQQGRTLIVPSVTLKSFVARHCPYCVTANPKIPAPIASSDIPDREKTARIALLESRLASAEAALKTLQTKPLPQSVVGPQGLPGRDGKPGKDAVALPLTVTLNTLDDGGSIVGSVTKTYQPGEPVILNFRPIQAAK